MNTHKLLVGLFVMIFLIGIASAATLGTYGLNQCVELKQTCGNCTYVNITSVTAVTNDGATVKLISQAVPMTKRNTEYNYTFCATGYVGEYTYITEGNPDGFYDVESVTFNVGKTSIILLAIMFIVIYTVGFFGFFGKNVWVSLLGGMAMIALGIFLIRNGIDVYRNFITNVIALTTIGLGTLFALTSGVEIIQESYN